jgi:hypothetical protein
MDPFRHGRPAVPAVVRRCPFGWCAVCCRQPLLVRKEFADLIRRWYSPAERAVLGQAARSAML